MQTQHISEQFSCEGFDSRRVEAAFDGGAVTSDAGVLLLRETDRAISLIERGGSTLRSQLIHIVSRLVCRVFLASHVEIREMSDHDRRIVQTVVTSAAVGGFAFLALVGWVLAFDVSSIATMIDGAADNGLLSALFIGGSLTKGAAVGTAVGLTLADHNRLALRQQAALTAASARSERRIVPIRMVRTSCPEAVNNAVDRSGGHFRE